MTQKIEVPVMTLAYGNYGWVKLTGVLTEDQDGEAILDVRSTSPGYEHMLGRYSPINEFRPADNRASTVGLASLDLTDDPTPEEAEWLVSHAFGSHLPRAQRFRMSNPTVGKLHGYLAQEIDRRLIED